MGQIELFSKDLVFFDFEATDQTEFFTRLKDKLSAMGYIKEGWLDAVLEREEKYPTGLDCGAIQVAIPHVDPQYLIQPYVAIIIPQKPLVFSFMGDKSVDVEADMVFNLGVAKDGGQVELLQALMGLLTSQEAVQKMTSAKTQSEMIQVISGYLQ